MTLSVGEVVHDYVGQSWRSAPRDTPLRLVNATPDLKPAAEGVAYLGLVEVDAAIEALDEAEDAVAYPVRSRCGVGATATFYLHPALTALPQHCLVFEYAPVEALREEIDIIPHCGHGRSNISAKAHWKPLAERMVNVRLVEEDLVPAKSFHGDEHVIPYRSCIGAPIIGLGHRFI
jgi:hypothetical protein